MFKIFRDWYNGNFSLSDDPEAIKQTKITNRWFFWISMFFTAMHIPNA